MSNVIKWMRWILHSYPCCGRLMFVVFPEGGPYEVTKRCVKCDVYYDVKRIGPDRVKFTDVY